VLCNIIFTQTFIRSSFKNKSVSSITLLKEQKEAKEDHESKQLKEQKEVKEPRSKRPKFGSPYVPRGRLQSQVSEDKDIKKRNADNNKDDSSTTKKMRGRGVHLFF
jgi:hypothetical protein